MSSKRIWVVLSGLLLALGACQRNYGPMVPGNGGPVTLTATVSPTVPVTQTLTSTGTPSNSPTLPVSVSATATTLPVTFTTTASPTLSVTATATFTPTATQAPPTPGCAGATVMGPWTYQSPVSILAGTVSYIENGAGLSGTVSTLHFYSTYGGGPVVVGLYSDNGGPDALLSSSNSVAASAGWNTVALNTPVNVTGGTNYWLALYAQGFLFLGGGPASSHLTQNASGLPSTYGGGGTSASGWLTIDADICPDSTVTPTQSVSMTATVTQTVPVTQTATDTWTPSESPTASVTLTPSETATAPVSQTATWTPTCACTGGTPTMTPTVTWTPTALTCTQTAVWGDAVTAAGPVSLYAGNTSCQKYALSQDSIVSRIYFDVVSYLPVASMAAGIYTDGGSYPGDLVWSSTFRPVTTGWNSIDVPQVQLGTGNYWLALATDQFVMVATAANSTSVRTRETALFQNPFIQLGGPPPTPVATPPPLSNPPDVAAVYADTCY